MKCIVPWTELNLRTDGSAQVCPFSPLKLHDHGRDVSLKTHGVDGIFNSSRMREIRLAMLRGETNLPECVRCAEEERIGACSKRVHMNALRPEYADRWARTSPDGSISDPPIMLHLPMGNTCNSQCRTCIPKFSSRIAASVKGKSKDRRWKKFVAKEDLRRAASLEEYIKSFDYLGYAWPILRDLLPSLRTLWLFGGEPTLSRHFEPLMDYIRERGLHRQLCFGMTTNLSQVRWLKYFNEPWEKSHVHFSFDGVRRLQEYVRYPLRWERFEENLFRLLENRGIDARPCITLSALNVAQFPEMLDYLNGVYVARGITLRLRINLLFTPRHLRFEVLPPEWRERIRRKLAAMDPASYASILPESDGQELLRQTLRALDVRLAAPEESGEDFFTFNESLDVDRGQSWEAVWNEFRGSHDRS